MNDRLRMTITFEDPDEKGWIIARVVEVPGALSQGRTREEARQNVLDALQVVLAPDKDDAACRPAEARRSTSRSFVEVSAISSDTFGSAERGRSVRAQSTPSGGAWMELV